MDSSPLVSSDSSWRLQFFQLWVIRVWNLLPYGVTSPSSLNGFRQSALPAIRSLKVPSNVHRLSPLTGTLPVLQESLSSLGVFIRSSKCTELAHEEITFIQRIVHQVENPPQFTFRVKWYMFYTNSNSSSNLGQKRCYTYKHKNSFAFIFLYFIFLFQSPFCGWQATYWWERAFTVNWTFFVWISLKSWSSKCT